MQEVWPCSTHEGALKIETYKIQRKVLKSKHSLRSLLWCAGQLILMSHQHYEDKYLGHGLGTSFHEILTSVLRRALSRSSCTLCSGTPPSGASPGPKPVC